MILTGILFKNQGMEWLNIPDGPVNNGPGKPEPAKPSWVVFDIHPAVSRTPCRAPHYLPDNGICVPTTNINDQQRLLIHGCQKKKGLYNLRVNQTRKPFCNRGLI